MYPALIDSGSAVNLKCLSVAEKLKEQIMPDLQTLVGLGRSSLRSLGKITKKVEIAAEEYHLEFSVLDDPTMSHKLILGEPFFVHDAVNSGPKGIQLEKLQKQTVSEVNCVDALMNIQIDVVNESVYENVIATIGTSDRQRLDDLIDKYTVKLQHPEPTVQMEAHMEITEQNKIVHRPRTLALAEQKELQVHIDKLLSDGIIQHSNSNFSRLIVLVRKISGDLWRLSGFKRVNGQGSISFDTNWGPYR